jgi:hypothetical protein
MEMYWFVDRSRSAPVGVKNEAWEKMIGMEVLR